MPTLHTGIRAYVFECTYNGYSWINDPAQLIIDLQTTLNNNMQYFSYSQLKIANVKNSSGKTIEIEILGINYQSKTKFTETDNDNLISELNTALLLVTNLTFLKIDICNDVFTDNPTINWPGQSFQADNS